MLDAPADAWYLWIGLALASAAALAVVAGFPTAPPPDADALATAIDRVATSPYAGTGEHDVDADAIRLTPGTVALRRDGATATAALATSVTPAGSSRSLRAVLRGTPPSELYGSRAAFDRAAAAARDREHAWHDPDDTLTARKVTWGDVDVTLVGG